MSAIEYGFTSDDNGTDFSMLDFYAVLAKTPLPDENYLNINHLR